MATIWPGRSHRGRHPNVGQEPCRQNTSIGKEAEFVRSTIHPVIVERQLGVNTPNNGTQLMPGIGRDSNTTYTIPE
jgi:hypothetical protein